MMLYPFFELSSVALSYKGNFLSNPAGLGMGGKEFSFIYADSVFLGAFSMWNTGIYLGKSGNSTFYGLSGGLNMEGLLFGTGYDFKKESYNIGLLFRKLPFLSLGATAVVKGGRRDYALALGIRPVKEYITIYGDAYNPMKKDSLNWKVGVYLQPFPYLGIRSEIDKEGKIFAGIEVTYSKVRLGISSPAKDIRKPSFGILISDRPFTEKVALKGYYYHKSITSYTEDGREGFNLFGSDKKFYEFIEEMKEVAENPRIKRIFLDLTNCGLSLAQAEELRNILKRAKSKGKEIVFFSESYGGIRYYLASIGKVYMAPEGDIDIPGPSAEVLFFKDALEKLGAKVQVFRVGKYKSAVEPFIQDTLSEANREQLKRLLEASWSIWLEDVSRDRNIPKDSLENIVKNFGYALSGEEALKFGLVDGLIYYDEIKSMMKGAEFKGKEEVDKRAWKHPDKPKIAVVVVEGDIVEGESSYNPLPIVGEKNVGSQTIRKIFENLRKDKSVKGVVLRVNSPGGSALASDIMAREIALTNKKKPVVVSMSSVAASGGYYISAPARKIFVDKTTITGSIGVFELKFVLGGFLSKLGLKREIIKLYPHSDAFSLWREMDSTELSRAQKVIDDFYWRFVKHVAKGRNLPEDSIHTVAQGRVWIGYDAVKIGLADGFGGILDAIEYVKKEANIKGDYEVVVYPEREGLIEKIKGAFKESEITYRGLKVMYRMEYDVNLSF